MQNVKQDGVMETACCFDCELGSWRLGSGLEAEHFRQREQHRQRDWNKDKGQGGPSGWRSESEGGGCLQIERPARNLGSILSGKALEGLSRSMPLTGICDNPCTARREWVTGTGVEPGARLAC